MKPKHFLNQLDDDALAKAIADAELKTTGKIRVFVSHHKIHDPIVAGRKHFLRLKLEQTTDHNAILILVVPKSHKFAILADSGIHERAGETFWQDTVARMAEHFKESDLTQGMLHAIREAGDLLAKHFPK